MTKIKSLDIYIIYIKIINKNQHKLNVNIVDHSIY